MSPEQARGDSPDRRSDIYSLGVMLYQMMAGKLPFDGENPLGILTQHMYVEPTPLAESCERSVPPGFEAIVAKCMSKERDDRYGSMEEVEAELLRLHMGQTPIAVEDIRRRKDAPDSLRQRLAKARKRRRGSWLPLYAILAAGALIAGWMALSSGALPFSNAPVATAKSDTAKSDTAAPKPVRDKLTPAGEVSLVVSPIDAHVFLGRQDLGTMPITVKVPSGKRFKLEVRREGYESREVLVDGSQSPVIVELQRQDGTGPIPPVDTSSAEGEARVITLTDAGLQIAPVIQQLLPIDAGPAPEAAPAASSELGQKEGPEVATDEPPTSSETQPPEPVKEAEKRAAPPESEAPTKTDEPAETPPGPPPRKD